MILSQKVSVLIALLLYVVVHWTEASNKEIIQTNQLSYLLAISKKLKQTIESSTYGPVKSVFQVVVEMQETLDKTVILSEFNRQTQEHTVESKELNYHMCQLRFLDLADMVQLVYMEVSKQLLIEGTQHLPAIVKQFSHIKEQANNLSRSCQSIVIINPLHSEHLDTPEDNTREDGDNEEAHLNLNQEECILRSSKVVSAIEILLKKSLKSQTTDRELFQHTLTAYELAQTVFYVCGLSNIRLPNLSFDSISQTPCFEGLTNLVELLLTAGRSIHKLHLFSFVSNMNKFKVVLESINQFCQPFVEQSRDNMRDYCCKKIEYLQQSTQDLVNNHYQHIHKDKDYQAILLEMDVFIIVRQLWQLRSVCERYQEDHALEIDFNFGNMFCPRDANHLEASMKQIDTCSSNEGDSHAKQTLRFFADQVVSTLKLCIQRE